MIFYRRELGINAVGTAFESGSEVLPFRTYLTSSAAASPRRILIGEKAHEEEDDETIGDLSKPELTVYAEGTTIVVKSNYETKLGVYSASGLLLRTLQVSKGTNLYGGFRPDIYIVGGTKLHL